MGNSITFTVDKSGNVIGIQGLVGPGALTGIPQGHWTQYYGQGIVPSTDQTARPTETCGERNARLAEEARRRRNRR